MTDPFEHADAAYVLGALDADERAGFEAHLRGCPECAARVRELRPLPGLLAGLPERAFLGIDAAGTVPPATVPPEPLPPETLLPGLLRQLRREQRRRHWMIGGLAAGAAACVLALVVAVWPSAAPQPPKQQAMTALAASPVSATVALQAEKWGTEIELTCRYTQGVAVPTGYQYGLIAKDPSGVVDKLGSWTLDPGATITFRAGTALRPDQIKSLQIRLPNGQPILQLTR